MMIKCPKNNSYVYCKKPFSYKSLQYDLIEILKQIYEFKLSYNQSSLEHQEEHNRFS